MPPAPSRDSDPVHSRVGFQSRHAMMATVRGDFFDVQTYPEMVFVSIPLELLGVETVSSRSAQRHRGPRLDPARGGARGH